jgi:hypothetical protein
VCGSGVPARRLVGGLVLLLALCAWCGWASGFRHSTIPAFVAWSASLTGVVAVDLSLRRGHRRRRSHEECPPSILGAWPWLVVAAVVVAWEVLGIDTGPHAAHLTISALAQAFRAVNAALFLAWIVVGLAYGVARAPGSGSDRPPSVEPARRAGPGPQMQPAAVVSVSAGHATAAPALLLPDNRPAGVAFWVGVVVACVVVDLAARRSRGRVATGGELLRLVSRPLVAHVVLVAAWGYAGWHLFAH